MNIENSINSSDTVCCFCNEGIQETPIDPCNISIAGHWDRDNENRSSQDFFCHFDCLSKHLHEQCGKSREYEISRLEFRCCFCNKNINQTDIDPCNIKITGNWFETNGSQLSRDFCFHFSCLETRLHNYIKSYLMEGIFSIKKNKEHDKFIESAIKYSEYTCCFCKQKIEKNLIDLCTINLLGYWDKTIKSKPSFFQKFFCHTNCQINQLHKDFNNSRVGSSDDLEFVGCCYCNELIKKANDDPCTIVMVNGLYDSVNFEIPRYYLHRTCLESRIHNPSDNHVAQK